MTQVDDPYATTLCVRQMLIQKYSQEASIISLRTSSSTATPMLSLVITLFSIASEPSELAMASWLNSTVCFCTALNLDTNGGSHDKRTHHTGKQCWK